jgi:hypothetical protein
MKFLLVAATLAGSACAFSPAAVERSSTALNEFARGYVGGEGPEPMIGGSVNYDPLKLTEVSHSINESS